MGLAGWEAGRPGIGEARLYAIQALLRSRIVDLSEALRLNVVTSSLITNYGALTPDMVIIGDMEGRWDIKTGLLRIAVSAGNKRNGLDATGERLYIGGINKQIRYTDIYLYFHDSIFTMERMDEQRLLRAIAVEVAADWLFDGVLNKVGNGEIPLTSRVNQDTDSDRTDKLTMCLCTTLQKGFFTAGMGNGSRIYYGIQAIHEGQVY